MKLLSFVKDGRASWGVKTDDGILDGGAHFPRYPTLRAVLEAGAIDQVAEFERKGGPTIALGDIWYLPVIPDPRKIFCAGLNYSDHIEETKNEVPTKPPLFIRTAQSQIGHESPLILPSESTWFDYEGEIAVIIGREGRRISEAESWQHIAGYAPYNDASFRDWQRHTSQWTAGKNFDGTGAFGPWMVTRDKIADNAELKIETRLNGQVVQSATTKLLIFTIPTLISYISSFSKLLPGDVIVTGTPSGVGARRNPPLWMKAGDRVEVEVSQLGVLSNVVSAEQ